MGKLFKQVIATLAILLMFVPTNIWTSESNDVVQAQYYKKTKTGEQTINTGAGSTTVTTYSVIDGCTRSTEIETHQTWDMRIPIDLVILQDRSGSFEETIDDVVIGLNTLINGLTVRKDANGSVIEERSDRVMVGYYAGAGTVRYYSGTSTNDFATVVRTQEFNNYEFNNTNLQYADDQAKRDVTKWLTDNVNKNTASGGTPTVPAIDDMVAAYKRQYKLSNPQRKKVFLLVTDGVANGYREPGNSTLYYDASLQRATALGFTVQNNIAYHSAYLRHPITGALLYNADGTQVSGSTSGYTNTLEPTQNYEARANEMIERGEVLKEELKTIVTGDEGDSDIVIGFFEDYSSMTHWEQQFKTYDSGPTQANPHVADGWELENGNQILSDRLKNYGSDPYTDNDSPTYTTDIGFKTVGTGLTAPGASIRQTFSDALSSMASKKQYYIADEVHYQPQSGSSVQFANRVAEAVRKASEVTGLVSGDFTVSKANTDLHSFTVNGKTIVKLTDQDGDGNIDNDDLSIANSETPLETNQVYGHWEQKGTKVDLKVDVSAFLYTADEAAEYNKTATASDRVGAGDVKKENTISYDLREQAVTDADRDEKNEQNPIGTYQPGTTKEKPATLSGQFDIGGQKTPDIGVELGEQTVEALEFCYPTGTKSIDDGSKGNDTTLAQDPNNPPLSPKTDISYGALLENADDSFTYTVTYDLNNSPLIWNENAKVFDKVLSQIKVTNATATLKPNNGQPEQDLEVVIKDGQGIEENIIYAEIPAKGTTERGDKDYSYLARTKVQDNGSTTFVESSTVTFTITGQLRDTSIASRLAILKENFTTGVFEGTRKVDVLGPDGQIDKNSEKNIFGDNLTEKSFSLGLQNQAFIGWNQPLDYVDTSGNSAFNKNTDENKPSTFRRTNAVYVRPGLDTEIKKRVNGNLQLKDENDISSYDDSTEELKNPDDEFDYTLEVPFLGTALNSYIIEDTIQDGLEIVSTAGEVVFTVDGLDANSFMSKGRPHFEIDETNKRKITITIIDGDGDLVNENQFTQRYNRDAAKRDGSGLVVVTFKAKIVDQEKVKKFADPGHGGEIRIPNTATVKLGDDSLKSDSNPNGEVEKESNTVYVTPPGPTEPEISKTIVESNAEKKDTLLTAIDTPYTYEIPVTTSKGFKNFTVFEVTDNLDSRLVLEANDAVKVVSRDPSGAETVLSPENFTIDTDGRTDAGGIIVKATATEAAKTNIAEGATVYLIIKARVNKDHEAIKQAVENGSEIGEIKNQANLNFNNENYPSNDTTVTVPPITKKVSDTEANVNKDRQDLDDREKEFFYEIKVPTPENATSFEVFDELVEELEFKSTTEEVFAQVNGKDIPKSQIKIEGSKLTVSLTEAELTKENAGKDIIVRFKAKIVTGADLAKYLQDSGEFQVPNTASYKIPNNPGSKRDSNKVVVVPPTPTPEIRKNVSEDADANNKTNITLEDKVDIKDGETTHANETAKTGITLKERPNSFTYTLNTIVPYGVTAFKVTDQLDPALEFVNNGEVVVKVGDEDVTSAVTVTTADKLLTVDFASQLAKGGRPVVITFKAKLVDGFSLDDEGKYPDKKVENKANIIFTLNNQPGEQTKPSNPVTVTPPDPTVPDVTKKISDNDQKLVDDATLEARTETFTYTINTAVPMDSTGFTITDTIESVLNFVSSADDVKVMTNFDSEANTGQTLEAGAATVTINGQTLTIDFNKDYVTKHGGQSITVQFDAKLADDANLSTYTDKKVPNKVEIKWPGHDPKESNTVYVTPPKDPDPDITKKIEGNGDHSGIITPNNSHVIVDPNNRSVPFMYNIQMPVPNDVTSFEITDTLVDELSFDSKAADVIVRINGETYDKAEVTIEGQNLKVVFTEEELKTLGGKAVDIEFKAYIKKGANLAKYADGVPNTAYYKIPNSDPKSSNTVYVKPPTPEEPGIEKTVNDKKQEDLQARDEVFTYDITTYIPTDKNRFTITDTLVEELQFADKDVTVVLTDEDGKAIANTPTITFGQVTLGDKVYGEGETELDLAKEGQDGAPKLRTLTVDLEPSVVEAYAGAKVQVTFRAKVRLGANLSKYEEQGNKVPNTASYIINHNPSTETGSNTVTVTPPSPDPEVRKNVTEEVDESNTTNVTFKDALNTEAGITLKDRNNVFVYTIKTMVPYDSKAFSVFDELVPELDFAGTNGDVNVKVGSDDVTSAVGIDVTGQKLTIDMTSQLATRGGEEVVVTFKAKIRPGIALTAYKDSKVPNTASITFTNNSGETKEPKSNTVTVTPPDPTDPDVTKKVSDNDQKLVDDATLEARTETFTYTITTAIPVDVEGFTITDTLEDVLTFVSSAEDVKVMTSFDRDAGTGQAIEADAATVTIKDQVLTIDFAKDYVTKHGGQTIYVTFVARFADNANLSGYTDKKVPNTAIINWPGHDPKTSNTVTVTPPPTPEEPITKKIEGNGDHSGIISPNNSYVITDPNNRRAPFTYNIQMKIPNDVTAFEITDKLEDVLGYYTTQVEDQDKGTDAQRASEVLVKVNGVEYTKATVTISGQDLKVVFTEEELMTIGGLPVDVEFKAYIKKGANLSKYDTGVPNTAAYKIPGHEPKSNTVYVTPPTPENPGIEKTVNDKKHEDLNTRDEVFTYDITTYIPTDKNRFTITDTLVEELQFVDKDVTVVLTDEDGNAINHNPTITFGQVTLGDKVYGEGETELDLAKEGQDGAAKLRTLTVDLEQSVVEANAGAKVVVTFRAKVREGANLTKYEADGGKVPNKASYIINHNPSTETGSNTVTVVPPTPEPEILKNVTENATSESTNATSASDASQGVELDARENDFTYTLTTTVPYDASSFSVTDEIDNLLQFAGDQGDVKVTVDNVDITDTLKAANAITIAGQLLTVNLDSQVADKSGKAVTITFKAEIKPGVNVTAAYPDNKIPNTGQVNFKNIKGEKSKPSNPVTVTPPTPTEPPLGKKVSDEDETLVDDASLGARNEVFTYTITSKVPHDAKSFVIRDDIEDVLEFVGTNGNAKGTIADLEKDGTTVLPELTLADDQFTIVAPDTLTITLTEAQLNSHGGQAITITFQAKIKEGANLSRYIVKDADGNKQVDENGDNIVKVPNTVSYVLNNNPSEDIEPVHITPPPIPTPPLEKKVSDKDETLVDDATLGARDEIFTYTVTKLIPNDITSLIITDEIKEVLEFNGKASNKAFAKVTIDGQEVAIDDIVTIDGQTLTLKLTEQQVKDNGEKELVLTFQAKIREGANLSAYMVVDGDEAKAVIPNTAKYQIDDKPAEDSNTVTVTPPPTPTPDIKKDVNGKATEELEARDEVFTYNITTEVPQDATAFTIQDELEPVLEFAKTDGNVKVVLDGQDVTKDVEISIQGQALTVDLTEVQVKAHGGHAVVVTFDAQIKAGANLSDYVVKNNDGSNAVDADGNPVIKVPNVANYVINNNPKTKKDSNVVPVTPPPPSNPPITKLVNNKLSELLPARDRSFTYTISTNVPFDATAFTITDQLEPVLKFDGGVTVTIGGQAVKADVTQTINTANPDDFTHKDTLTVNLTPAQVKELGGQKVVVTFDAKIKEGANLSAYIKDEITSVPNTASYVINNDPKTQKDSNTVPVTPPTPPTPEIKKDVNGQPDAELDTRDEVFTYNITTAVPLDATAFTITDTIEPVLEFAGEKGQAIVKIDGKEVEASVAIDGQTLTVDLTEAQVKNNGGKAVVVSFKANIREGANLNTYITDGVVNILNVANYVINNDPKTKKDSNVVPVTPPDEKEPPIVKDVNDQPSAELDARDEVFTYHIKTNMPVDATAFKITDTLEPVLGFVGLPTITLDGQTIDTNATISGQNLTVEFTTDQVKNNGTKAIVVTFQAKIKAGVSLTAYEVDDIVNIPNTASYIIDNNPDTQKDSNTVPVTPPNPENPPIVKDVNGAPSADLATRDEVFTYNIKTTVPEDAKAFTVKDRIEDVLEFTGAAPVVVLNGQTLANDIVSIEGQLLTVNLTEEQVVANGGKEITVSFQAKIREGANLANYIVEGKASVPNQATYVIDNNPDTEKASNIVPVTPPTPPMPPATKDVNGQASADLAARDEIFTYNIKTQVPYDAVAFTITDTLEPVLKFAGDYGDVVVTIDGQESDTIVNTDVNEANRDDLTRADKLTVELTPAQVKEMAGKEVVVTFKAQIKQGANLSAYIKGGKTTIPNTAEYEINNNPDTIRKTNTVPVTPPNPEEPPISKDVNGELSADLAARDEVFAYNIKTQVPFDATTFTISDTLEPVLKLVADSDVTVTIDGEVVEAKITRQVDEKNPNNTAHRDTLTVELTEEQVTANGGKEVVVSFDAQIKTGANLSAYVKDGKPSIPNTANYVINNDPKTKKDSNTVPVTPPTPENPPIVKDVNGAPSADLATRDEVFTYNIATNIPADATAFTITDQIEPVLEFATKADKVKVTIDGKAAQTDVKMDGQVLTVNLTADQVKTMGGKEVVVTFDAQIKEGANLSAYTVDGVTSIPNQANYVINNNPDTKKDSNVVPVTPPDPENPPIVKDVNGGDYAELAARDEVFTYNITTAIPTDATAFTVSDTLEPVLEFNGDVTVTLGGKAVEAEVETKGQTLTVNFTEDQVKNNGGKAVVVTFNAKIKAGANLADYIEADGNVSIPNVANYVINNNPDTKKDSNVVPVTPPNPQNPPIVKDVNGQPSADLEARDEVFTYNIATTIPVDATAFTIADTLEPVLEFNGRATVQIDGKNVNTNVTIDGQNITVDLTPEQVKNNGGKAVVVSFKANIKTGANLSAYVTSGKVSIPNVANYVINNNPSTKKDSNVVPVTPPPTEVPTIEKDVNGQSLANLAARDEVFTYNLHSHVPTDKTAFTISDTLEPVLEFNGEATVTIGGKAVDIAAKIEGQTLTVALNEQQIAQYAGQAILVSFKANIKDGANLSAYVVDHVTSIPNTAKITFNNDPKTTVDSNTVPVIPPTPENPPIVKDVNGEPSAKLKARDEVFTYNIKTNVPKDAKAFVISDTLESVLEFNGDVTVTIDGQAVEADVTIEGQNLAVALTEKQVTTLAGREVVVSFKAKIKAGANLSGYLDKDGKNPSIPNTANYVIDNNPRTYKESNTVPVTPPTPENPPIVKDVNGQPSADLATRDEDFTYNITTAIPVDAVAFTVTDTLEPVLDFNGDVTVTLDGKAVEASIMIEGQTLTVTFTEDQVKTNGGKAVVVTFGANIKAGANLSAYTTAGKVSIPNVASYIINNNPSTKKDSNVVPVTPPPAEDPGVTKKVNNVTDYKLGDQAEIFTYTIHTAMPVDASAFEIGDTLEPVLEFNGDVAIQIGDQMVEPEVTVNGKTLTVKFTKDQVEKYAGQAITVIFNANISGDATEEDLAKYTNRKIPNTATIKIDNKSTKKSNPVTVVPPTPETPEKPKDGQPTKMIENVDGSNPTTYKNLPEHGTEFRYHISADLGSDLTQFAIADTLEPVLEITNGRVEVTATGKATNAATKALAEAEKKLEKLLKAQEEKAAQSTPRTLESSSSSEEVASSADNKAQLEELNKQIADTEALIKELNAELKAFQDEKAKAAETYKADKAAYDKALKEAKAKLATTIEDLTTQVKSLKVATTEATLASTTEESSEAPASTTETSETTSSTATEATTDATEASSMDETSTTSSSEVQVNTKEVEETLKALTTALDKLDNLEEIETKVTELQEQLIALETKENADIATVMDDFFKAETGQLVKDLDALYAIQAPAELDTKAIDADIKAVQADIRTVNAELSTTKKAVKELTTQSTTSSSSSSSSAKSTSSTTTSVTTTNPEIAKQEALVEKLAQAADKEAALYLALSGGNDIVDYIVSNDLGTVTVNGNSVRLEITDAETLASLAGFKVHLYIYANIIEGADLTPYLVGSKYEVPNTATVEFNHKSVKTNTVKVARPKEEVPPVTPKTPTPVTPTPVTTRTYTSETPSTRTVTRTVTRNVTNRTSLPATGDNHNFLEVIFGLVMLAIGLFTLQGVRKRQS